MTDVSPIGRTPGASLQPPTRAATPASASQPRTANEDRVEVSAAARYLARLAELPDVRLDLIEQVRAQIAAGTYETPDKIESLLDELAQDLR